ncbi:DUF305 domain-containing protein [Streptomyces sp. SID8382]|uniref:DUF305 domain-containing protein n=1 Tax=Streptomyces malaysiensis TaxID=92644 RepID=UPI000C2B61D2|nr:DUF305 domain-containing protein [Streptomyces sp. M56]AUA15525.1 hypothetical protein CFP59_07712 [Streptomyces sp. M56]MYX56347.1 DUF305 domain-containing protein [Streptomyces sp. SID8382]
MLNRRTTLHTASLAAAAAVAALALVLTGCDAESGGGADSATGKDGKPAVIAPGKPGEAAKKLSAEEAAKAGDDDSPNAADRSYVRMMIEHHRQALVMTDLAPDRAGSAKVERLAERIASGQKPEIEAMRAWQKTDGGEPKGGDGDGHEGHDAKMPGMATAAQLERLRAAKGADFDALFLKLMITHHRGAVSMATDLLAQGNNIRVEEMANDVIAQQSSEIRRMRQMT